MSNTKIKKDSLGLYVNAGGHICRPFYGTCFKEGVSVSVHYFGGSTIAGVGIPGSASFKKKETFEYWSTTGTGEWEKRFPERWQHGKRLYKRWESYVRVITKWYWTHSERIGGASILADHNKRYARDNGRRYESKAYYASRRVGNG
jgi:hypothetical protein